MAKLTPKQARFVEEYLLDLNAAAAARRAGYTSKRSEVIGYHLLTKADIQSAIQSAQRERSAQTGITAARVVQEIARIAFADPRMIAQWNESGVLLRPSSELTDEQAAAVAEVKNTAHGVSVKLHNKVAALEQLAKHVGLYAERTPGDESQPRVVVYIPGNDR